MNHVRNCSTAADKITRQVWLVCTSVALSINISAATAIEACAQTVRATPMVTAWLPPDRAGARYDSEDQSSAFVEILDSGLYVNWSAWLKKTSHRVEPVMQSLVQANGKETASIAEIVCRKDGTIESLIIDGQRHWPHRFDKQLSTLKFANFPKGSHLSSINLHFDLSKRFCTFVPQLTQMAATSHWQ